MTTGTLLARVSDSDQENEEARKAAEIKAAGRRRAYAVTGGTEARSSTTVTRTPNPAPDGKSALEIFQCSAAELERDLRRMSRDELLEERAKVEQDMQIQGLTLAAREALSVWREMTWMILTDRDCGQTADKWDQISARFVRAVNGKPDKLRSHTNALAIRAAHNGRRTWGTALHEAAHAVIAHSQGADVEEITVWRSDGPACVTLYEDGLPWESKIMHRVAAREALRIAEIPFSTDFQSDISQSHAIARAALGGDEKRAAAKVKELGERVADMLVEGKYTRQLLKVARALSERVTLTGAEFRELVGA